MSGPARGRRGRVTVLRAPLPCLALILALIAVEDPEPRPDPHARPVPPRPRRLCVAAGFAAAPDGRVRRSHQRCRQRRAAARQGHARRNRGSARSRPTAFPPPAAPLTSGYNSLNRKRKKPKYYPGQAKPKPPLGPGSQPPPPLPANGRVRLSIPPSETANKTPIAPAMAGTVVGQPPRKRLRIDDDPFGAVGDYAGSFLIKSARRTARRLRHQSRAAPCVPQGIAVLCGRAGIPRVLRLGAPRRRRRPARLVHRLHQHFSAGDRRHRVVGAGR